MKNDEISTKEEHEPNLTVEKRALVWNLIISPASLRFKLVSG
jgi:hypothetical protein